MILTIISRSYDKNELIILGEIRTRFFFLEGRNRIWVYWTQIRNPVAPRPATLLQPDPQPCCNQTCNPAATRSATLLQPDPQPCCNQIRNPAAPRSATLLHPDPQPCCNQIRNPAAKPLFCPKIDIKPKFCNVSTRCQLGRG